MIAAYIRVSSKGQDLQTQRDAILRASKARGDVVRKWFSEKLTATKIDRPELVALRQAVREGAISKVYVFRIDRLARTGIRDTLTVVEEFRAHGCELVTIADGFSLGGPATDVVLAVLAWAAQMERSALAERISAARIRIEAAGGRWGRPRKVDPGTLHEARMMRKEGKTIREVSIALKIPRATISDALSGKGHYGGVPRTRRKKPSSACL